MTIQEEIGEGVARVIYGANQSIVFDAPPHKSVIEVVGEILSYLHSQGLRLPNGEALIDETNK